MKKIHTLSAIAVLALAAPALAADNTQQNRGAVPGIDVDVDASVQMPMVDKNSDGKVTRSEAASNQGLSQQFDKLDANKDGSLDKAEYAKFEATGEAKAKAKGKGDRNRDGVPGKDEGDPANTTDRPGTTDDSTPGNQDKLGPGR